jgi:hypothetical protein
VSISNGTCDFCGKLYPTSAAWCQCRTEEITRLRLENARLRATKEQRAESIAREIDNLYALWWTACGLTWTEVRIRAVAKVISARMEV